MTEDIPEVKKEWWVEKWTEIAGLLAAVATTIAFLYTLGSDHISRRNKDMELANERLVVAALRENLGTGLLTANLEQHVKLDPETTYSTVTSLVAKGLVSVHSDGSFHLATTEFNEVATKLQETGVALNDQIAKIQIEIQELEKDRNKLMGDGNKILDELKATQEALVVLGEKSLGTQVELVANRKATNEIAIGYSKLMESNNAYMAKNTSILEKLAAHPEIDDQKFMYDMLTAMFAIRRSSKFIGLTNLERELLKLDAARTAPEAIEIYKILHKCFPKEFPAPSPDPYSSVRNPEMRLISALALFTDPEKPR